jgi:hypothetical protein
MRSTVVRARPDSRAISPLGTPETYAVSTLILVIFAFVTSWSVSLFFWPWRRCSKCGGSGLNRGSNTKRFGECRRCRGNKRIQRLGSRTPHRAVWTVRGEFARQRQARRDEKAAEKAEHLRRLMDKEK